MKKFFIFLLLFLLCSCNQKQAIDQDPFLDQLNKYPHDQTKIDEYIAIYEQTNNLIYAINKVNHQTFLIPNHTKTNAINKEGILLVNTNYYLDQTYLPNNLVLPLDVDYIKKDNPITLSKEAYAAYLELYNHAKQLNYHLTIFSGYRSYEYQDTLYQNNKNGFVAKPGASEHQSGYAIDISLRATGLTSHFDNTNEAKFLFTNAHLYGFILRYPQDKTDITGYPYESWHYRYVGKDVAKIIYENNLTLEEYFYYYILL